MYVSYKLWRMVVVDFLGVCLEDRASALNLIVGTVLRDCHQAAF